MKLRELEETCTFTALDDRRVAARNDTRHHDALQCPLGVAGDVKMLRYVLETVDGLFCMSVVLQARQIAK